MFGLFFCFPSGANLLARLRCTLALAVVAPSRAGCGVSKGFHIRLLILWKSVHFLTCHQAVSLRSVALFRSSLSVGRRILLPPFSFITSHALYPPFGSFFCVFALLICSAPLRLNQGKNPTSPSCFGGGSFFSRFRSSVRLRLTFLLFSLTTPNAVLEKAEKNRYFGYATSTTPFPRASSRLPLPCLVTFTAPPPCAPRSFLRCTTSFTAVLGSSWIVILSTPQPKNRQPP